MVVFTAIATAIVNVAGYLALAATVAGANALVAGIIFYGVQAALYLGISKLIINRVGRIGTGAQDIGVRVQLPPSTQNKLPVVYGKAYVAPIITDADISSDNKTMWYVCALAEVTDTTAGSEYTFGDIYYDSKLVTFDNIDTTKVVSLTTNSDPVQVDSKINGYVYMYLYKNGSTGATSGVNTSLNAYDVVPKWDSTYAMTNTAFLIVKVVYNTDAGTTALAGVQVELTNSLTKPGAVLKDYMLNPRYGCALPLSSINTASLTALDTYSDELITYVPVGGGSATQARYRIDGPIDTGSPCLDNLQTLVDSCDSWLQYAEIQGQWSVIINQSYTDYTTLGQLYHVTDDNITGGLSINPIDLNEVYNIVEVQYPNENIRDQLDIQTINLSDFAPEVMSPNEAVNKLIIQYPIVNNAVQAKYLGLRRLLQGREDLGITFATDYSGIQVTAGDVIRVTFARYGWVEKLFRVSNIGEEKYENGSLGCRMTAFEYNDTIYADNSIQDFIPEENTGVADPNILSAPTAPLVVVSTSTATDIQNFSVVSTVTNTGTVTYLDFLYGTTSTVADHILYTTIGVGSGAPLNSGTAYSINVTDIAPGDYYWSTRARNNMVGQNSVASPKTSWTGPNITTYNTLTNTGGITTDKIQAGAITADKISVIDLSAVSANMGTLTSGNIKTANTGFRLELSSTGDFAIWYGTGDKTTANALFYLRTNGEAFMSGVIQAQPGSTAPANTGTITVSIGTVSKGASGFAPSGSVTSSPANVVIGGGTPPYTYAWSKIADTFGTTNISSTSTAAPTFGGVSIPDGDPYTSNWSLTVTDSVSAKGTGTVSTILIWTNLA
jgi:hypothetical protein